VQIMIRMNNIRRMRGMQKISRTYFQ